ncbi:hypothetical protein [Streptomyces sp. NRRL S-118]|uniref:hypothetical protein n=1 Tax=Streptomyces sp. NRRL S-118 TaxID=1463881 RepID=UPI00131C4690|nr:hypothetical protein [Streptomyces sp. NRRL S-118]
MNTACREDPALDRAALEWGPATTCWSSSAAAATRWIAQDRVHTYGSFHIADPAVAR